MALVKLKNGRARLDGRPQYYDIVGVGDRVQCYYCLKAGVDNQYARREAVSTDPANPPPEEGDKGSVYTLCCAHLPVDAVIYDPLTNTCRDKTGYAWQEG